MREYDLWIDGDYYESAKAHCAADALDKMETLRVANTRTYTYARSTTMELRAAE